MKKMVSCMMSLIMVMLLCNLTVFGEQEKETQVTYQSTEAQQLWHARAFGQSTDLSFSSSVLPDKIGTNYVWSMNADTKSKATALTDTGLPVQDVTIESRGGKIGKSHDGLVYYYTELPTTKNFVLTADVTVTQCGPETGSAANAQEGAGLMVRDANGDARKDPEIPGYSEYPAASNLLMLYYGAQGKAVNPVLNLKLLGKYGLDNKYGDTYNFGTSSQTLVKSAVTGDGTNYATTQKLRLEKTDTSFICYYLDAAGNIINQMNMTDKDKNVTPNMLTQLDNDKYTVGFFCARNMAMNVQNIDLKTSDVVNADTTPYYKVVRTENASIKQSSSEYINGDNYTVAFLPTHSGKATIMQDGQAIATDVPVTTWKQYTLDTKIAGDTSEFEVIYTADQNAEADIVVKNAQSPLSTKWSVKKSVYENNLYVSPDGTETGAGTKESPMNLNIAIQKLIPGGTIYMMEGTYASDNIKISRVNSGTEKNRKSIIAVGNAVIKGKSFSVEGDYWDITGVEVDGNDAVANPLIIKGNYNIFDKCITHDGTDTGFYIKGGGSNLKQDIVPSYNLIKNCESYENRDASGINADGFAAKLGTGEGNRFEYCISHDNADDGWDLFNKLGENYNGVTTISHCISYNNGNNGYKMGGEGRPVAHVLEYSLAYNNALYGITDNFNPGKLTIKNNECFNNKVRNISISLSPYAAQAIVINNISYKSVVDALNQSDAIYAAQDSNNYLYTDAGNSLKEADFVSVDQSKAYTLDKDRNIILGDFLKPVYSVASKAGFYEVKANLTVTSAEGGTVTGNGSALSGEKLEISSTANEGYEFSGWEVVSGKAIIVDPAKSNTTVTLETENVEIKAVFKEKAKEPVTDPTKEPVTDSTKNPTKEPTTDSGSEPITNPTNNSANQLNNEQTTESTGETAVVADNADASGDSVKTSDTTPIALYSILSLLGFFGMGVILMRSKAGKQPKESRK